LTPFFREFNEGRNFGAQTAFAVPAKRSAGLSMRQAIGQPMQNSSTTKSPNRSINLLTGWHRDANELK
jgi:hypothetical protein